MSRGKHRNRPQPIPVPERPAPEAEPQPSLSDRLKRVFIWVKPLDFGILIVGLLLLVQVDFAQVTLVDIVYMASFAMWFIFLLVRIYLTRRNRRRAGLG